MKSSTLYRLVGCVAAVGFLLAAIASAGAQTTVKIALAVPNYGPFAPIYAADELGYFRDAGLKAEITAYRGGPAAQEALAAGAADIINFFPPGVALAVKKGWQAPSPSFAPAWRAAQDGCSRFRLMCRPTRASPT